LLQALAEAGFLDSSDWDTAGIKLSRYKWSRTARTDARVHALCQIVACKLYYKEELFKLEPGESKPVQSKGNNTYKDARASVVRPRLFDVHTRASAIIHVLMIVCVNNTTENGPRDQREASGGHSSCERVQGVQIFRWPPSLR